VKILPQNPTQLPFDWSLFWDLVNAAAGLQKDSCKALFNGIDPTRLLRNLAIGKAGLGTITRRDLGANNTSARTENLGSRTVTLSNGSTVLSIFI
jgi:hypothetical protein